MCGGVSLVEKWLNRPFSAQSKVDLDNLIRRFSVQHTGLTPVDLFNAAP
jgi:hypothetical protein